MARKAAPAPHSFDVHRAVGGTETWRRLAVAFYARVERDPVLRPLFPGKTLHCAIEEFAAFLVQFFGGPAADSQRRWWLSLRESHLRFRIGQKERAAWMKNMAEALDDADVEPAVRGALREFFEQSSAYVVTSGPPPSGSSDPADPPDDAVRREIACRWDAQRALDEAAAAVRDGDAERAISLAESAALRAKFARGRSTLTGLLAMMIGSRNPPMLRYVREVVTADPALARERYGGRTLLHEASGRCEPGMAGLLLRLGADPDAKDGGGHTPLYSLANECKMAESAAVVRALVEGGANVNACDGVKRTTALHMAARRNNVEIAEALLDFGAEIEARDSQGETPLRRAVNCNQIEVAAVLLRRGADVHSRGSKGLTPFEAARSAVMKQLLGRSR